MNTVNFPHLFNIFIWVVFEIEFDELCFFTFLLALFYCFSNFIGFTRCGTHEHCSHFLDVLLGSHTLIFNTELFQALYVRIAIDFIDCFIGINFYFIEYMTLTLVVLAFFILVENLEKTFRGAFKCIALERGSFQGVGQNDYIAIFLPLIKQFLINATKLLSHLIIKILTTTILVVHNEDLFWIALLASCLSLRMLS